jgi:hypothetical protein
MSQSVEEQLSALLDNELTVQEEELLFRRLGKDPEHSAVLSRYSLIRELIVSSDVVPDATQLSERVRVALQDETVVGDSDAQSGPSRDGRNGLFRFAAVAAVAAIALMAFVNFDIDPAGQQSIAFVSPDLSYAMPDSRADSRVIESSRLTGYLVSHSGYSNTLSRRVMDSQIVSRMPRATAWQVRAISSNE